MIKRRILGFAQAAFVGGTPQAEYVAELGMASDRIFLGYNAVDNDYFAMRAACARGNDARVRAELALPERYFLVCSRLIPKKNLFRLLEAFARYHQGEGDNAASLVIVGPGPLQQEMESRVAAERLGGLVHLKGASDYATLPIYYGLAQALVLPSVSEPWGLVVNEAMASGLPVVVSKRCGCARNLVQEGRNGFTFDPFDVAAIADAMRRISSDCGRAAMGVASREIIANWGLGRFAAGFEAAAMAALSAAKKSPLAIDVFLLKALALR
jgi:glycosyltransferase involved in cell wall biosynthesis